MQRLAEAYPDELVILGVNWGEERGGVEDYVGRLGVEYPILLDPGLDTFYRWAGTDGLPRHYFIGAEATILREIVGPLDPARMVDDRRGAAQLELAPDTTSGPFMSGWTSQTKK